jgi:sterol desaturase/sphingolipid hydroxylase (fatty acid hydroxylase superfamily)
VIRELIDLAVSFVLFGALAQVRPCNPGQRRFLTREFADNILYWGFGLLVYGDLVTTYIRSGAGLLFQQGAPAITAKILAGYGPAAALPLWLQAILILFGLDFLQYWLHRLLHEKTLWPFHAVHHSAEELDWSSTYRIHPINFMLYGAGALALIRVIGFSPIAFAVLIPFNLVIGPLVHANLDWTFGPFRYVIASPVFHRWHHVKDPAFRDKNFAPTFPVLDLMFGTFYMPKGVLPQGFGVDDAPRHFLGQMVYPFRAMLERVGQPGKTGQSVA